MFTFTHIDWIVWSGTLSPWHLGLLLLIVLLVFGPSRLPELSRALGRSIKDFKKGLSDIKDDLENADQPKQPPQVSVPPIAPVAPSVPPVIAAAPPVVPPAAQQPPRTDSFPSDGDPR